MRYVGLDPSTSATGLVVLNRDGEVEEATEIKTKKKTDPHRFMDISNQIARYIQNDDLIMIEGFSYGSKGKGVSTQYGVGWIIRANLVNWRFTYHEVAPSALKKFTTGNGTEKKENMIIPIYNRWGFQSKSDNIRDAYVLAQIARYSQGLSPATQFQKEVLNKLSK